jgi:hypothetical protein
MPEDCKKIIRKRFDMLSADIHCYSLCIMVFNQQFWKQSVENPVTTLPISESQCCIAMFRFSGTGNDALSLGSTLHGVCSLW